MLKRIMQGISLFTKIFRHMPFGRMSSLSLQLSIAFLGLQLSGACSNAETPDAYYLAAPVADAGIDLTGTKDNPCRSGNRCDDGLSCVNQNSELICRAFCDGTDEGDPCGQGATCRRLSGDGDVYVCLPASGLDGTCPCDEGFVCTEVTEGNRCKYECFFNDAGSTDCPVGACRRFTGSNTNGACVE